MLDRMIMQLANFSVRQNQIEEQYEKSFAKLKESLDVVKKMRKGRTMKIQSELIEGDPTMVTPVGNQLEWGLCLSSSYP
ncbi:hypothetical protein KY290_021435 [Solanum tuberosum]|uniref:Uncharacterized protein n=1 Tax=Solanum tuberosum TaxID=4113 RepID=A0ABQ7V3K1_SOLTU|nr:hypothetical protein KY289_020592 [Solanum tuberosum]KAH0693253.1 hypothetical protein KY285_020350 [Solanum tuberosum]KAH0757942.1 hypothetical protein KY290_021435 [Solanum tuberosum]